MIRLLSIVAILLTSITATAQTSRVIDRRQKTNIEYLFQTGDTIKFFPLNPKYHGEYAKGYTCFYDKDCSENGFKPKFRFQKDKNKLTPCEEIENSFFYVRSICTPSFNSENGFYFSAVLERLNDHKLLYLAIPSNLKKEPQESLIRTWMVKDEHISFVYGTHYKLVIPFLTKKYIDWFDRQEGKVFFIRSSYSDLYEDFHMLALANGVEKAKCFQKGKALFEFYSFKKFDFMSIGDDLVYSQPFVMLSDSLNLETFLVPAFHFAGNCNSLYTMREKADNLFYKHFGRKDLYLSQVQATTPRRDSLIGNTFHYDANKYYYYDENKWLKATYLNDPFKLYPLTTGIYKCIGFDFFLESSVKCFGYYAIFEDNIGRRFRVPVTFHSSNGISSKDVDFTDVFISQKEIDQKAKKEADDKAREKALKEKYGEDVGLAIYLGKCTEERYAKLKKKYGIKKAGLMARRVYEVGWTYDEFLEAKNPNLKFECVYTHESRYAYYEVYTYGYTDVTYITFKNGVIVSIDDYMPSAY